MKSFYFNILSDSFTVNSKNIACIYYCDFWRMDIDIDARLNFVISGKASYRYVFIRYQNVSFYHCDSHQFTWIKPCNNLNLVPLFWNYEVANPNGLCDYFSKYRLYKMNLIASKMKVNALFTKNINHTSGP